NSVYIGGSSVTTGSSAGITGASAGTTNIKNNVFFNARSNSTGTGKHYAISKTSVDWSFTSDYNDYYVSGTGGVLFNNNGTDITTLANWRIAYPIQDAHSINVNPLLNSATNLQPIPGSSVLLAGTPIAGITTDYLNVTRHVTTPSIGAYEQGSDASGPNIAFTDLTNGLPGTSRVLTGFALITDPGGVDINSGTSPRVYYKKSTDANAFAGNTNTDNGWKWVQITNAVSPFDFTLDYTLLFGSPGGVVLGDIIQYFVVAQDLTPSAYISCVPSAGFMGTSVSSITAAPTAPKSFTIAPVKTLTSVIYNQASTASSISGSTNQEILRLDFTVAGTSGTLLLNSIVANSLNTSDADVTNVKLFRTSTTAFSTSNQLGTTASFTGGNAAFSSLVYDLPAGTSYIWLTYDVSGTAVVNNYLDAQIQTNQINVGGLTYPAEVQSPAGSRKIGGPLSGTYAIGTGLFNKITGRNLYPFELTRKVKVLVPEEDTEPNNDVGINDKSGIKESSDVKYKEIEVEETYTIMYENGKPYEGIMKVTGSLAKNEKINTGNNLKMSPDSYNEVFADIPSAISELNLRGVSGAVIFEFTDASYSTSGFALNAVVGVSAANTITFKPQASESVEITGSSATALIDLSGCQYVTFDGSNAGTESKDMSISNTNTSGATIRFINDASNCTVKNSIIKGVNSNSSGGVVLFSTAVTTGCDNNTINNCSVTSGTSFPANCFYFLGTAGKNSENTNITNNIITNFSARGVYLYNYYNNTIISGNDIYEASTQSTGTINGIRIYSGMVLTNVTKNKIHDLNTSVASSTIYGIYFGGGASGDVSNINNNLIYLDAGVTNQSGVLYGFNANGISGTITNFHYNSVYIGGSSVTTGSSAGIGGTNAGAANIKNNVLYNARSNGPGTGKHYAISKTIADWAFTFDYNDYYVSGTGGVLFNNNGTDIATLADWRIAYPTQDANSINGNPGYTSTTNLLPDVTSPNAWNLYKKGTQLNIAVDYAGTPRCTTTVCGPTCIGAYEFTIDAVTYPPPPATANPVTPVAGLNQFSQSGRPIMDITFGASDNGIRIKKQEDKTGNTPNSNTPKGITPQDNNKKGSLKSGGEREMSPMGLPTSISVQKFSGVASPNYPAGSTAKRGLGYWKTTITGTEPTDPVSVKIYFGDEELGDITTPATNIILSMYNAVTGVWLPFPIGAQGTALKSYVDWNARTIEVAGIGGTGGMLLNNAEFMLTDAAAPVNRMRLDLTAMIDGLYNDVTHQMVIPGNITVELHSSASYTKIDESYIAINTSGQSVMYSLSGYPTQFTGSAIEYWIVFKHWNSLETWSASVHPFSNSNGTLSYDFTTLAAQAYGDNMIHVGSKWCIYTGDINQDGSVDLNDLIPILTDYDNADYHAVNDLNGDGAVDLNDAIFVLNGYDYGIGIVRPSKSGIFNTKKTIDVTGNKALIDKINNLRKTIQDVKTPDNSVNKENTKIKDNNRK
ncbi:MAG: hypothetical protein NTV87_13090, partial [Ignavibacteriae bacterium]|nr:hypothetical protein [Ignavibacteriota bacterium]